jgi:hypothetical protein
MGWFEFILANNYRSTCAYLSLFHRSRIWNLEMNSPPYTKVDGRRSDGGCSLESGAVFTHMCEEDIGSVRLPKFTQVQTGLLIERAH